MTDNAVRPSAISVFCKEPYRLFFPLGFIYALIGSSHWIWFHLGWTEHYGAAFHGFFQIQGFGTAFAVGFLMTALPRFLETPFARVWELGTALLLSITSTASAVLDYSRTADALFLALFLFVVLFAVRRFHQRKCPPPPEFVYVLSGFIHAIAGAAMILYPPDGLYKLGERMVQQGILLSFIMTFGSYLGVRLLGLHNTRVQTIEIHAGEDNRFSKLKLKVMGFALIALGLFVSFWIEAAGHPVPGRVMRALAVTLQLGVIAGLVRLPRRHFPAVYLLWLSFLFTMAGLWISAVFPAWEPTMNHFTLIGGFGLMILIISMRVTLAHGGFEEYWLKTSAGIVLIGIGTLMALALRICAQFWIEHYIPILAASAICWNIALIAWALCIVPKMAPRYIEE